MDHQQHEVPSRTPRRFRPGYPGGTGRSPSTTPTTPPDDFVEITFRVRKQHAAALRSAIEELRNRIGSRMEGRYKYEIEDALVAGSIAVAQLAAAVNAKVPSGDRNWRGAK